MSASEARAMEGEDRLFDEGFDQAMDGVLRNHEEKESEVSRIAP